MHYVPSNTGDVVSGVGRYREESKCLLKLLPYGILQKPESSELHPAALTSPHLTSPLHNRAMTAKELEKRFSHPHSLDGDV